MASISNREWSLGYSPPILRHDGSNYHEWRTRVLTRAKLYKVYQILVENPTKAEDRNRCLRFLVLIQENISSLLHPHCDLDNLADTWASLQQFEPDMDEAEAELLKTAFKTELHTTTVDEFIKIHTETQAKLHRLNPELQAATPTKTYHRILACASALPMVEHIVQPARQNADPTQTDLLQLIASLRKAAQDHAPVNIAAVATKESAQK